MRSSGTTKHLRLNDARFLSQMSLPREKISQGPYSFSLHVIRPHVRKGCLITRVRISSYAYQLSFLVEPALPSELRRRGGRPRRYTLRLPDARAANLSIMPGPWPTIVFSGLARRVSKSVLFHRDPFLGLQISNGALEPNKRGVKHLQTRTAYMTHRPSPEGLSAHSFGGPYPCRVPLHLT
jgi:hypothetical protein